MKIQSLVDHFLIYTLKCDEDYYSHKAEIDSYPINIFKDLYDNKIAINDSIDIHGKYSNSFQKFLKLFFVLSQLRLILQAHTS